MSQFPTQGGIQSFQLKSSPLNPFNSHLILTHPYTFPNLSLDLFHLASLQTLKMFVTFEWPGQNQAVCVCNLASWEFFSTLQSCKVVDSNSSITPHLLAKLHFENKLCKIGPIKNSGKSLFIYVFFFFTEPNGSCVFRGFKENAPPPPWSTNSTSWSKLLYSLKQTGWSTLAISEFISLCVSAVCVCVCVRGWPGVAGGGRVFNSWRATVCLEVQLMKAEE